MTPRIYKGYIVWCFVTVCLAACFAGCARSPDYPMKLIDDKLRSLAGKSATNCGRIGVWQKPNDASDCAIHSFADQKSFTIRFVLQGIDSIVAVGLASNSAGDMFAVEYDSNGWSSKGLSSRAQLSDRNRIFVEPCPKPIILRKSQTGRLTCYPPNPNANGYLMSPVLGPY